jgi:hypothetical protein
VDAFLALVVVLGLFLFLVGRFLEVRNDWRTRGFLGRLLSLEEALDEEALDEGFLDEGVLDEEALDEEALEEVLDEVLDRRWGKKKDCQQQPQHPDPTRPDPLYSLSPLTCFFLAGVPDGRARGPATCFRFLGIWGVGISFRAWSRICIVWRKVRGSRHFVRLGPAQLRL